MRPACDLHIHTVLSRCCCDDRMKLENIVPFLAERGIRRIGISDHFWANPKVVPKGFYERQNGERILAMREQISALDFPVTVLLGGEAEMTAPGHYGVTAKFREKLDYLLLATNHFHLKDVVAQPEKETLRGIAEHMLTFFKAAARDRVADILVHPMVPFGFLEQYDRIAETISDAELEDAFHLAAENDVAVELNAAVLYPFFPREFNLDTPSRIYELARRAGCLFTFGSDAHALAAFDKLPLLEEFADRIGLTQENISPLAGEE